VTTVEPVYVEVIVVYSGDSLLVVADERLEDDEIPEGNEIPDERELPDGSGTPAGDEDPVTEGAAFEDMGIGGDMADAEIEESIGFGEAVEGDDTPDDCENRLDGMMTPGGNELGLYTRIVVVASGSIVFKMVVLLK
jgi:hypothetical protein